MTNKYTAEQIDACILCYKSGDLNYCRQGIVDLLTDYAALLRERESAKAAVTDEIVRIARDIHVDHDGDTLDAMRAALEAVAPMLASARVPDAIGDNDQRQFLGWSITDIVYSAGWNQCRKAMLAAAPKPETEE